MSYVTATELPILHVPMTQKFISAWCRERSSDVPTSMTEYFKRVFGLGYIGHKHERQPDGLYVIRFDKRSLIVPVHANSSSKLWEMEARGFYHERRPFQLGRRNMVPAAIDGDTIKPGIVIVDWKTMY